MPLFRRKTETSLPRTSSISVYGQGRAQVFQNIKNAEKLSDSSSFSSADLDERPHFLAFAEATFDPSLPMKTKSRLSKDLEEVLNDNAALAYFIQFMDASKAKHLVKFWLEAESFRISSETKRKCQNKRTVLSQSYDGNLLPSSSSSDCVSDKSDEVFQSSSHASGSNSKHGTLLKTKHDPISENVNINDVNSVPHSNNLKKTERQSNVSQISSKDEQSKTVQQSSSVDSGCEDKLLHASNPSKSLSNSVEVLVTEAVIDTKLDIVNSVHKVKLSSVSKDCEQESKIPSDSKEQDSDSIRDGLGRLETSIEQDANSIYCKYITQDAPFPIGIKDDLRSAIKNNIMKSGEIDPQCFVQAQEFIVKRMDKEYFPNFLRSSFHCKHQIDVLTSGTVFLADVLYNDSALFYFMEFMEQEGVRHLVDFLLMADNFQKHLLSLENYDGMQAQTDAMVLYEKYFSLQATNPLGFSDEIRYEVEANICREEGPLPDCFLKPVKILMQYLEKTYLLQFLNSQLYFKYISECVIIIQNSGNGVPAQQKYTVGSDSGSEQSLPISSVNTLLAMDSKQPGTSKIIKNLGDQDMRIDTIQFKPDALWQRPLAGRLQMAHVDHLGRVTTEFEPEPDKRRESRISKAVKKLVSWEEDKNQEDMAWKVAEMIVKDICSITMPEANESAQRENHPS